MLVRPKPDAVEALKIDVLLSRGIDAGFRVDDGFKMMKDIRDTIVFALFKCSLRDGVVVTKFRFSIATAARPAPLVLFIHGGRWSNGDKNVLRVFGRYQTLRALLAQARQSWSDRERQGLRAFRSKKLSFMNKGLPIVRRMSVMRIIARRMKAATALA